MPLLLLQLSFVYEKKIFIPTYAYVFDELYAAFFVLNATVLELQSLWWADECVFVKVKEKTEILHLFEPMDLQLHWPYRIVDYGRAQTVPC